MLQAITQKKRKTQHTSNTTLPSSSAGEGKRSSQFQWPESLGARRSAQVDSCHISTLPVSTIEARTHPPRSPGRDPRPPPARERCTAGPERSTTGCDAPVCSSRAPGQRAARHAGAAWRWINSLRCGSRLGKRIDRSTCWSPSGGRDGQRVLRWEAHRRCRLCREGKAVRRCRVDRWT